MTGQRHALATIRLGLLHDVEKNPGPSKTWKCTKCRKGITRKTWSVKCNGCSEWIHWDCTKLGEDRRWSPSFLGECCQPIQEEPANCCEDRSSEDVGEEEGRFYGKKNGQIPRKLWTSTSLPKSGHGMSGRHELASQEGAGFARC